MVARETESPGGELAEAARSVFALFDEVQILAQVSAALLARRLPEGMPAVGWGVVNLLARMPQGATTQHLARAFQMPPEAMAALLDNLDARGLVASDGRRQVATPAGHAFRERAMADLAPEVAALAGRFSRDRMEALIPELAALRRVLDGMREG